MKRLMEFIGTWFFVWFPFFVVVVVDFVSVFVVAFFVGCFSFFSPHLVENGQVVTRPFFIPSCKQEDLDRSRALEWDFS